MRKGSTRTIAGTILMHNLFAPSVQAVCASRPFMQVCALAQEAPVQLHKGTNSFPHLKSKCMASFRAQSHMPRIVPATSPSDGAAVSRSQTHVLGGYAPYAVETPAPGYPSFKPLHFPLQFLDTRPIFWGSGHQLIMFGTFKRQFLNANVQSNQTTSC